MMHLIHFPHSKMFGTFAAGWAVSSWRPGSGPAWCRAWPPSTRPQRLALGSCPFWKNTVVTSCSLWMLWSLSTLKDLRTSCRQRNGTSWTCRRRPLWSVTVLFPGNTCRLWINAQVSDWHHPTSRQVVRSTGRQVVRSPGRQVVRSTGRQVIRSSGRQVVRSSGRQVDRSSGRQVDRSSSQRTSLLILITFLLLDYFSWNFHLLLVVLLLSTTVSSHLICLVCWLWFSLTVICEALCKGS